MRKIFRNRLIGLMLIAIFTGCSSQTGDSSSADYRQEFTDSEIEEGHAEFDIAEHLSIDADITPLEKYENGLNSYYEVNYTDSGDLTDEDSFAENTTIFGHEQDEFYTLLEELFGVSVDRETVSFTEVDLSGAVLMAECRSCGLNMNIAINWNTINGVLGTSAYCPIFCVPWDDEDISNYATYIKGWLKSGYEELDFGDPDEIAETYMSYLEEITGRELSDTYDCITVSETTLSQLADKDAGTYMDIDTDLEECYYFLFYYDIDGLPIDYLGICHELEDDETCSDILESTKPDDYNTIYARPEWAQRVAVSEDGVMYLHFDNLRDKGEIYKESLDIITPTEILEKVVSYYDTMLLLDDVVITDVRLVYNVGFTDGEDGIIDEVFCPMWKVIVYDYEAGMNKAFLYDAETGEAYYEAYELGS